MKKLYIVYKHYDYDEGNSEPIAVCSSRRRAEKYGRDHEIIELELNKPIHKPLEYLKIKSEATKLKNFFDLPDFVFKYPPSCGGGLLDLMDKATSAPDTNTYSSRVTKKGLSDVCEALSNSPAPETFSWPTLDRERKEVIDNETRKWSPPL